MDNNRTIFQIFKFFQSITEVVNINGELYLSKGVLHNNNIQIRVLVLNTANSRSKDQNRFRVKMLFDCRKCLILKCYQYINITITPFLSSNI